MNDNGGISRICFWCNETFICYDGDYFCSIECEEQYEESIEEEEENTYVKI